MVSATSKPHIYLDIPWSYRVNSWYVGEIYLQTGNESLLASGCGGMYNRTNASGSKLHS